MNTPIMPVSSTSIEIIYSLILFVICHEARIEIGVIKVVKSTRNRLIPSMPT